MSVENVSSLESLSGSYVRRHQSLLRKQLLIFSTMREDRSVESCGIVGALAGKRNEIAPLSMARTPCFCHDEV